MREFNNQIFLLKILQYSLIYKCIDQWIDTWTVNVKSNLASEKSILEKINWLRIKLPIYNDSILDFSQVDVRTKVQDYVIWSVAVKLN